MNFSKNGLKKCEYIYFNTMETFQLPTEDFSAKELVLHFNNGLLKNHIDAINYISQYYFEVDCGNYYKYDAENDDFIFKEPKDFTNEVTHKVDEDKDVKKYFKTNTKIYKIISNINKPRHFKEGNKYYINLCSGILHKTYKPYDDYDKKVKESVQLMISFMKEVYCNNDDNILQALLKYYKQLCQGKKTEVVIYNKSIQGIGKSTGTDFLIKYV
jgi:hypothetical protein